MAIKIDRELAGDINNPSAEVIAFCIKEHQKTLDRLNKLNKYYDGEHDILTRKKDGKEDLTNVMVNNAKYVTDMNVGFMLGNPIAYTPGDKKSIGPIIEVFDEINIKKHDRELEKDLSVFGLGYEMLYLSLNEDETLPKVACIDPRGILLVTDNTVESNPLFAVRYIQKFDLEGNENGYRVEVYTSVSILKYDTKDLEFKSHSLIEAKEHYFGGVPVIEYRNNEEKQGDFEQAMTLINAYNVLTSDRINDKEAFIDAILVLYGFTIEWRGGYD